jgi:hypothetical protein
MKFFKFDNFTKFSVFLINTKFFYRTSSFLFNSSNFPLQTIEIPFSDFYNSKSIDSFWNFIRSVFYLKKTYQSFPFSNFHFFKRHYVFYIKISSKIFISSFISFFKIFKKRNNKLFSRFYLSKNFTNFSFFFRDSHFFTSTNSNIFDYYNWKTKLFFKFTMTESLKLSANNNISFNKKNLLNTDYKFFLLYHLFSFSNKKILCVIFYQPQLINVCIITNQNLYFHNFLSFTKH